MAWERETDVFVYFCVFGTYLFLTSTQWRENQTKGLETSDKKTILQFPTAIQTRTLFVLFVCGCVCVTQRESLMKNEAKERKSNSGADNYKKGAHTREFRQFTFVPCPCRMFPPIARGPIWWSQSLDTVSAPTSCNTNHNIPAGKLWQ